MNPELRRKRYHLVAMAAVITVTLVVLYLLGTVLLALGLSVVAAYVLLPVARLLERAMPWRRGRPDLSRGIAVTVIFIAALGILAGLLALVIPPTVEQGQRFAEEFPAIFQSARITVEGWVERYTEQIPPEIRSKIEETAGGAGGTVIDAAWSVVTQTLRVVSGSFAFILGLATAPMMIFYLMKDSASIRASLSAPFPQGLRPYLEDALDIADRTIGAYIRAQLTLGIIVGTVVTIGLLLLGVPFAFVLGTVAGLTELVPVIGPWIGGAAGVLVTLATEPEKLPWVILLYLVVQLLENVFLVPRIQGDSLKLHPVAVIMVIVIASHYFGLWGIILGPPVLALIKDLAVYLAQEWNRPPELTPKSADAEISEETTENLEAEDSDPGE